ncbi:uncharacterized protein LY89DRAFT_743512 [Mollisia scopiformis]|uniref:Uncharacterized protein n=1 Tax=Mollisia scopiformis TaxID=149040 RepID=A0A132B3A5_MOLSC|nr:uncharacterized protein LY89DRAFT_743512 [Mollisia scopiformis]KUJ06876.1 hypothetical protein LY89DRAFT_743512 [Mollisia scopiformis]
MGDLSHFLPPLILLALFRPAFCMPLTASLTRRYVPPETYVAAAKLSAKAIILIVIFVLVSVILSTCTCYICIKRRRSRARARRLAREREQSKQLKPRINKRNARFFAPGLVMDKIERDRLRDMRETEKAWAGKEDQYEMWKMNSGVHVEELKRPETAKGGWREVLRGVVVKK